MTWVSQKGNDESFDKLLKRFKKKLETDNILPEYKRRMFYEKPGERKKRKRKMAERRRLKKENKGNE